MSNLSPHAFTMDAVRCSTVEGFIHGIKFPPGDTRREQIFAMDGYHAWKMRVHAEAKYVWWDGKVFLYQSREHADLIRRAIEEKFFQNPDAMEALKATAGLTIIHETSVRPTHPHLASLPADIYCRILTDLRERVLTFQA